MPTNPAAVRTKKYALPTQKYISLAMRYFFKTQLKWVLVPVALILINAVISLPRSMATGLMFTRCV